MFTDFFFLLRAYGVPVTITEWLMLMEALAGGLAFSNMERFYSLARSVLVKSETFFDQYDQAFAHAFRGIETPLEIAEEVWEWLNDPLAPLGLTPEEVEELRARLDVLGLDELRRLFEERLAEQKEAHHGGSHYIGTGGTSPLGHSGVRPGGMRIGGTGMNRSAVKVAEQRRYRAYRTDATVGVRQFELALRRLRQLSSRHAGPLDELDLEQTIQSTADHAGALTLEWRRPRRNNLRVALLMDAGGSMHQHLRICSQLFTAVNRQTHFKELRFYYFHNCVYDHLYLDPTCHPRKSVPTPQVMHELDGQTKLVVVGDASMAPYELLEPNGIIWWSMTNAEPGIEWLRRLAAHFTHSVWLNPVPSFEWETVYGRETIELVSRVFPMYDLSVDGLTGAVRKLLVRR